MKAKEEEEVLERGEEGKEDEVLERVEEGKEQEVLEREKRRFASVRKEGHGTCSTKRGGSRRRRSDSQREGQGEQGT